MSTSPSLFDVFTPGAPINKRELFAGRIPQLERVLEALSSAGRHPVVFGQRGVGKTSFANILNEVIVNASTVKINCDSSDEFDKIWRRVLSRIRFSVETQPVGFPTGVTTESADLLSIVNANGKLTPSDIDGAFEQTETKLLVILDEYDRVRDEQTRVLMADLVKTISDNSRLATLVFVGVSASINELIGEHPSIARNLVQIEMPKMTDEEIKEIVRNGCERLGIQISTEVLTEIASLANGFPHYAHLLGLSLAKACQAANTVVATSELFRQLACDIAIEDSIQSYREKFGDATRTGKPSRYPEILCACGHATHDERGVFRATDVVDAMRSVFGEHVNVQSVVPALGEFCTDDRGPVLEKVPYGDRSHYRFADPMFRPFLRIKTRALKKLP